ncbi:hypothetical protein A8L33_12460 [Microbacterium aurantiacum]|nr:hypothetical protein A8L33_12460 [Microbacterium chocolatum]
MMLALGAFAGAFGFYVMLFAAAFLLVPAMLVFLIGRYLLRHQQPPPTARIWRMFGGWAVAAVIAVLVGSVTAWAPVASESPFSIDPLWAVVLPICALVGALIGSALEVVRSRQQAAAEGLR